MSNFEGVTFKNFPTITTDGTDFSGCTFTQCCSHGPLLTIDDAGSVEGCKFEAITTLGDDGYVIYSACGKKKDVRGIKKRRFIDCETESEDGRLVYCCYYI